MARIQRLPQSSRHHNAQKASSPTTRIMIMCAFFCFPMAILAYIQFAMPSSDYSSITLSTRESAIIADAAAASVGSTSNTTTTNSNSNRNSNSNSYQLASDQSFGFFDDIPDYQWKRAQEIHSRMFPNYFVNLNLYSSGTDNKDPKFLEKVKQSNHWNGDNFHVEFHCPLAQRIPTDGRGDGPKWICDPHRLRNIDDCLIYSFGSNGKAEFEQGIHKEVGQNHCEVHTFDPKKQNKRHGDFAQALKGYSTFHHWGLGTEEEMAKNGERFKTLRRTMEELGHVNRTIHVFKIDCEWCEWFTHEQWIEFDLRQILVETHNAPMPEAKNFFFGLHDAGYTIFSKEANYAGSGTGVEFGFLKLSKDFFDGKFYKDLKKV